MGRVGNLVKVLASDAALWASRTLEKAAAGFEGSRPSGFAPFLNAMTGEVIRGSEGDKLAISFKALRRMRNTDPVTWAIHNKIKTRVTRMARRVIPDIEAQVEELASWERQWLSYVSKDAVDPQVPIFRPLTLSPETILYVIQKTRSIKPGEPGSSKKVRWVFDSAVEMERSPLVSEAEAMTDFFAHCNLDTPTPFNTILETMIDDILQFDQGFWPVRMTRGGEPFEIYSLPGDEMVKFLNPDRSTPQPPLRAYGWKPGDKIAASFTTKDGLWITRNPQKDGLGMSPLEACFHVITGSLFADAYNLDMFQSNIPPGVLNLGNISDAERRRFRLEWENEVMGRNRLHRLLFVNSSAPKLDFLNLKQLNTKDMQYIEYVNWTALVKCMVHEVSPQDVGITLNVHKETSQTQSEMSSEGIDDMACTIEESITQGILVNIFEKKSLKFVLERKPTSAKASEEAAADSTLVDAGIITRNEARAKRSLKPFASGGDVPTITTPSGLLAVETVSEEPEEPADPEDEEGGLMDPETEGAEKSATVRAQRKGMDINAVRDARAKRNGIFNRASKQFGAFSRQRGKGTMRRLQAILDGDKAPL